MNKPMNRLVGRFCAVSVATLAASAVADTHNVAAGVTDTLSGITETTATVKGGDGTLGLSGANTLKRLQVAGGTLHISGGTTTVSDSTATGTANPVFLQTSAAKETVVDGGAAVTISGGQYAITQSGLFVVSNATVDATGLTSHFMNAFSGTPGADGCKVVIGEGGVLRAGFLRPTGAPTQDKPQFQDTVGVVLKEGGKLYINQFWTDSAVSRYGRIWFDGGTVYPQQDNGKTVPLFNWPTSNSDSTPRVPWVKGQLVPTVMKGGFHMKDDLGVTVNPPFRSGVATGETDGGVHFSGKGYTIWYPQNSDYNGGTWLESNDGALLRVTATYGDSVFGAVPESPSPNIFATGSNHTLYLQGGTLALHTNRTVSIPAGKSFKTAAAPNARLIIGGEIKGEATGGLDYPTNTYFEARGSSWTGTTVLAPGDRRTNDVGRLVVRSTVEISNGVTRVASHSSEASTSTAVLYIVGNNASYGTGLGRLVVSGGEITAPQSSRFVYNIQYGEADICGGTVSMPNVEWLNAQNTTARTIIRDGGILDIGTFRVAQGITSGETVVHLATNGLLRASHLYLDPEKDPPSAVFLFDGGALQSKVGTDAEAFVSNPANKIWDNVKFAIGPGGAIFDTSNGMNLWWRRPLVKATADAPDGGLTARGKAGTAVILMKAADYNGPTTIDGCTLQQRGGDNLIPAGTKLVLKNGGILGCTTYDSAHTPTMTSFSGVEGDGELRWCAGVGLSGTIAPSIGGTLKFTQAPASLSNITLEIAGDATGCGKVEFNYAQDISGITLSMADPATFDKQAAKNLYKIVANGNYTSEFKLAPGWPSDWAVQHKADGVYLSHIDAFMLVVR